MSNSLDDDDDLGDDDLEDEFFSGYLATVEVCIETPEGEVADNLCLYVECEFDHPPTYEELGLCALDETQPWLSSFLYGGSFQDRFGNNPTVTIGNIIIQRI